MIDYEEAVAAVHLDAGYTRNGNRKECVVLLDGAGHTVDVIEDWYEQCAHRPELAAVHERMSLYRVPTTTVAWRDACRQGKAIRNRHALIGGE